MPPVIGYAAAAGTLRPEAWVLAAISSCGSFRHFYSIAWMYKDDYARAGIRHAARCGAGWALHGAPDRCSTGWL